MSVTERELQSIFEADWQQTGAWRQQQLKQVESLALPKVGKINFKPFNFEAVTPTFQKHEPVTNIPEVIKTFVSDEENIVIVLDGSIIYKNLNEALQQVKITSYNEALEQHDTEVLEALWADLKEDSRDKLHAINKAYRNSGLYIRVPDGIVVKDTIKIHIIASRDLVHRSVIVARPNSELKMLEIIDNVNSVNVNYTTQTEVLDNAHFRYLGIDRLCEETPAYIDRRANVYRDGNLIYALGQLNDGNTISNNIVHLKGQNANCETRSVLMTDHDSVHAVTVHVEHQAEHSVGNIVNHGIVKDRGYLHIDGVGKIQRGQKRSNAQQHSEVITLSDQAKVVTNPYLLIDEYDVMAGHGAVIGQVDEEQLYYMMSRGMTRNDAEKLIIIGFLSPIIEMIDSEQIREDFTRTIERKLNE